MSSSNARRWIVLIASVLAASTLMPTVASQASRTRVAKPHVSTGGARRLAGSSAELTAVIEPKGFPTSYYFEWGPTTAYGAHTPTVSVGNGTAKVKVVTTVTGLQQGVVYHCRVVAVYTDALGQSQPPILGRDRTFALKGQLKFEIPKIAAVTVGGRFVLSGTLRGLGGANHAIALEASPYPSTTAFVRIGVPGVTDAAGRFAFRVANLATSTAFRVVTIDTRPFYSPVVTVAASVHVILHVRAAGKTGLFRLYGTVTPAVTGAHLYIQLQKPIKSRRPTNNEATTRFADEFGTVVKKGGATFSRFSLVARVLTTGRYRALVRVRPGAVISGSSATVLLHAGPSTGNKAKPKKKK
jgi:hypothetical protein